MRCGGSCGPGEGILSIVCGVVVGGVVREVTSEKKAELPIQVRMLGAIREAESYARAYGQERI